MSVLRPPRPAWWTNARQGPLKLLAPVSAATLADVALDPEHRHLPLCPFHALTGWQCPLCGGLRAVDSLVHGRLVAALHDNLVVVAALPVVAALWLICTLRTDRPRLVWSRTMTVAVIVLAVGFTLVRNLPFATALRP